MKNHRVKKHMCVCLCIYINIYNASCTDNLNIILYHKTYMHINHNYMHINICIEINYSKI